MKKNNSVELGGENSCLNLLKSYFKSIFNLHNGSGLSNSGNWNGLSLSWYVSGTKECSAEDDELGVLEHSKHQPHQTALRPMLELCCEAPSRSHFRTRQCSDSVPFSAFCRHHCRSPRKNEIFWPPCALTSQIHQTYWQFLVGEKKGPNLTSWGVAVEEWGVLAKLNGDAWIPSANTMPGPSQGY